MNVMPIHDMVKHVERISKKNGVKRLDLLLSSV